MIILDTNVLLDIATFDPTWKPWSTNQLKSAMVQGRVGINPIIYAEFAPAFSAIVDLDQWLDRRVFDWLPIPYAAGWLVAQAYKKYRRSGGTRTSPLLDFYIGAHAEVEGHTLVTRDAARYRTYFPNVKLVTP